MQVDTCRLLEYLHLAPYRERYLVILEQLPKRNWQLCKQLLTSCIKDIQMHYGVTLQLNFTDFVQIAGGIGHVSISNRLKAMLNGVTLNEVEE